MSRNGNILNNMIDANKIIHGEIFSACTFVLYTQSKKQYPFVFRAGRNNYYYFRYNCADVISRRSRAHIGGFGANSENTSSPDFTTDTPGQRYRCCRSIYRGSRLANIFTRLKAFTRHILGMHVFNLLSTYRTCHGARLQRSCYWMQLPSSLANKRHDTMDDPHVYIANEINIE